MSRSVSTAAAVIIALTLAACGGSQNDPDPGAAGQADEVELGPLDEYFQQMYGGGDSVSQEQQVAESNRQMVRVEEIVAACMRDEGFEYTPVDQSMNSTSFAADDLDVQWGTKEFAAQYGYGATTDPGGMQAASEAEAADGEEFVDPNQDYVAAMSETEQAAFYAALYGAQSEVDPAADPEEVVEYNWEDGGCQGKAQHEVYEGGAEADEFSALQDDMGALYEAVAADPRLAAVNAEWASCMADAGFDGFAAIGDGETSIYDALNAIQEEAYGSGDAVVELTEETAAQAQADVEAKTAELTPREIKTAVADYQCREDADYDAISQEVNVELQQEFVDSHKAELDAWLAASNDAKS
ncbi:hypothetical protein [Pengzhenrongella sicca]|uniref:Uncharacterized protein n=1 Tax=Pengzhenrongella sicca TaxID=2819238 RepID=A0A8A4ZCY5_9MICO|nr:hypothetical protein [Pengzhenrongella sicca]QTE28879.1 hypothetical protein J4E96_16340 [Pengzhenrongella sicca]